MNYSTLLYDVHGGVARITLNRPESYNAINLVMARELADAALRAEEDQSVRVVVLRGAGRSFSVGGDLKDFDSRGDQLSVYLQELTTDLHTAVSRFARMSAPVVATVHGSAAGGGMSLACACDLVIATESARFTTAYTRLGLTPDGSGTYFLPRLVGLRRALDLMLTSRVFGAREAMEWGLVTEVVPDEMLETRVEELVRDLVAGPVLAFGGVKQLLLRSGTESLETQMALEARTMAEMAKTLDAKEGIRAFIQKRKPHFEGPREMPQGKN